MEGQIFCSRYILNRYSAQGLVQKNFLTVLNRLKA
jgi:hypothetical protein